MVGLLKDPWELFLGANLDEYTRGLSRVSLKRLLETLVDYQLLVRVTVLESTYVFLTYLVMIYLFL